MGFTASGLPYPEPADTADIPRDIKALAQAIGVWQTYTPTVSGAGWVPGASTFLGRYCRIGNTVHFASAVTLGAGFTMGSASLIFSLPVPCSTLYSQYPANATFLDVGSNNYFGGAYVRSTGALVVPVATATHSNQNFSATVPFAWAVGDGIYVAGTYEAASLSSVAGIPELLPADVEQATP